MSLSLRLAVPAMLAAALAAAPALAQNFKVGHFGAPGTAFDDGVKLFIDKVAEVSGGKMKGKDFPSGQLGDEAQEIGALQGGLQEVLITSSTNLIKYDPLLKVIDLPFLFSNDQETDKVLLGPIGTKLLAGLDGSKMIGLVFWDNGFRDLSNSRHPITQLSDFKGLNFRVIGAPIYIDTFKALGANPVPMPFPEVYTALQTGTVDGQDNPLLTVRDLKFYEVQKYLTHSRHAYSAMIVLVGKPFWDRLSEEQKGWFTEAAKETAMGQRQIMRGAVDQALSDLKDKDGMQVVDGFSPEALAAIRKAVQPVVDETLTEQTRPIYDEIKSTLDD